MPNSERILVNTIGSHIEAQDALHARIEDKADELRARYESNLLPTNSLAFLKVSFDEADIRSRLYRIENRKLQDAKSDLLAACMEHHLTGGAQPVEIHDVKRVPSNAAKDTPTPKAVKKQEAK